MNLLIKCIVDWDDGTEHQCFAVMDEAVWRVFRDEVKDVFDTNAEDDMETDIDLASDYCLSMDNYDEWLNMFTISQPREIELEFLRQEFAPPGTQPGAEFRYGNCATIFDITEYC